MTAHDDGATAQTMKRDSGTREEFLAGVRSALADPPEAEVAEILDEVRTDLADLTAETGGAPDSAALPGGLGSPVA